MVYDEKTVSYVHQAIMLGWSRSQVDAWAAQQEPPIGSTRLDAAYAACVEQWITDANVEDGELYALHVARREDLYRRAMSAGDLALAHKILVDQAKLQQQYRSEQRRAAADDKAESLAARIRARAGKPALTAIQGRR